MAEKSTRGIPETVSILLGRKYRVFKGINIQFWKASGHAMFGNIEGRCGRKSHAMNSVRLMGSETYWKEIKAGDETKASIK